MDLRPRRRSANQLIPYGFRRPILTKARRGARRQSGRSQQAERSARPAERPIIATTINEERAFEVLRALQRSLAVV